MANLVIRQPVKELKSESKTTIRTLVHSLSSTIGATVYGQSQVIEQIAGAMLIGGHVLLEGPPGIAKTLLAKTFAKNLGLHFSRIQFTPDLTPSDITGVNVFDPKSASYRLVRGPIFGDIILADEINRTNPKTQSALLQAMEEQQVSIDGKQYELGEYFFVVATQNPIEHLGTFPLPEAQLDRFLFKLDMSYPSAESEQAMVASLSSHSLESSEQPPTPRITPKVTGGQLIQARHQLRSVCYDQAIGEYMHSIITATRSHTALLLGASPRAAVCLALGSKFQAALAGRNYVTAADVQASAPLVIAHRIIPRSKEENSCADQKRILAEILESVPCPRS